MKPSNKLSEAELLLLLRRRDENALSELFDLYAPAVYGLIINQVKNEKLAIKILQTTFLNIWKECSNSGCSKQRLFTWILSLTYKTAITDFKIDLRKPKGVSVIAHS